MLVPIAYEAVFLRLEEPVAMTRWLLSVPNHGDPVKPGWVLAKTDVAENPNSKPEPQALI